MAADIQEGIQAALSVANNEKGIASNGELCVAPWSFKSEFMGDQQPLSAEDCSTLELVDSSR